MSSVFLNLNSSSLDIDPGGFILPNQTLNKIKEATLLDYKLNLGVKIWYDTESPLTKGVLTTSVCLNEPKSRNCNTLLLFLVKSFPRGLQIISIPGPWKGIRNFIHPCLSLNNPVDPGLVDRTFLLFNYAEMDPDCVKSNRGPTIPQPPSNSSLEIEINSPKVKFHHPLFLRLKGLIKNLTILLFGPQ